MKNLETKQKIFDKVVKHLFKQELKAYNNDTCCYLTDDGLKCAVGCLIPYSRLSNFEPEGGISDLFKCIDDYSKDNPKNKTAKDFKVFIKENENLLNSLQNVHDQNDSSFGKFDLPELKRNLIIVAKMYKLNYNHLKQLTKEYK